MTAPEKQNTRQKLLKILGQNILYGLIFGFSTMLLLFWVLQEMPYPLAMIITMSFINGALFMLLFKQIPRKVRILYAGFVLSITFTVGILFDWIARGIANLIPMSFVIGLLVFLAFVLFTSAVNRSTDS